MRIEDTDRERSTPEAIRTLLEAMEWLGLDYDEAPVYQSAMLTGHVAAAERLIAEGKAYRLSREGAGGSAILFRIPYESPAPGLLRDCGEVRVECDPATPFVVDHTGIRYAVVSKKGKSAPVETSLAGHKALQLFDAAGNRLFELGPVLDAVLAGRAGFNAAGVSALTFQRREVVFDDVVKGSLAKPLDGIKDLVIVRSDGSPVFHLANVCDDVTMRITHIIRGDDHVENTFRHLLLFAALGAPAPRYAHLPMIVNAQGKPYSKRDGDAYVGDFRLKGFLGDALLNYLALLGWSPGDDREKMTRAELIAAFTLDRVKCAPAQMDLQKLTHMNAAYVGEIALDEFVRLCRATLAAAGRLPACDDAYFRAVCELMKSRTHVFSNVLDWEYFFVSEPVPDEKAVAKFLAKDGVGTVLKELCGRLAASDFELASLERCLREAEQAAGLGEGKLNQPVRVAVTGVSVGAGLYETMAVLGRERVLSRLARAAECKR